MYVCIYTYIYIYIHTIYIYIYIERERESERETEARGVLWSSSWEMDTVTKIQILDEAVCISHRFGKCMNPTIFHPASGE